MHDVRKLWIPSLIHAEFGSKMEPLAAEGKHLDFRNDYYHGKTIRCYDAMW